MEVHAAINAAVSALLDGFGGAGPAAAKRPVLELVFVLFSELARAFDVGGLADDLIGLADVVAEGVVEADFDETDGEMSDVDADPSAVEALGDLDGGAAAAEGIEDYAIFSGRRPQYPF